MDKKKELEIVNYWQDVENKDNQGLDLKEEFPENTIGSGQKNRRDFLKIMGFSLSVIPLATSCKKIVAKKAIPYLHKSDQVTPGVANWYATTNDLCPSHCALLVKTREGRPIKVEGNPLSPFSQGGTCPLCQASVLSLYDSSRFKTVKKNNQYSSYAVVDSEIKGILEKTKNDGKRTALVINSVYGPSLATLLSEFKSYYGNVDLIVYNPAGLSALVKANAQSFGKEDVFRYNLEKANLILGISSDFLATGPAPVELSKGYAKRRDLFVSKNIIRHIQVESIMSMTGTNADRRLPVSASEESVFIHNLVVQVQKNLGKTVLNLESIAFREQSKLEEIAAELVRHQGESVIICGSTDPSDQVKVNVLNSLLGNFDKTLQFSNREYVQYEKDEDFEKFLDTATEGNYGAVIFYNVNPYYDYFNQDRLALAMKKVGTKISLAGAPDETALHSDYICPDKHYLEKWDDYEIGRGVFSFSQPVIQSLFENRAAQESLLVWMGKSQNYEDYIKNLWTSSLAQKYAFTNVLGSFWNKAIHDGVVDAKLSASSTPNLNANIPLKQIVPSKDLSLVVYEKIAMRKGNFANNPWLQELPDPVTKVTWDNYLMISPVLAKAKAISTADMLRVKVKGKELILPALVQPGVHAEVVALALGYGRSVSGKAGKDVGVNAFPFLNYDNQSYQSGVKVESLEKTGKKYKLAMTQTHHSMEGRDIVRESTLGKYIVDPKAGNPSGVKLVSMWSDHKKEGHQWAMMIDLNKCNGCSGCVISCNAENNVPVVGKEEVYNRREMHWMRLDRYYKGNDENPEVVHQPMLCAHCDNAPCETVCPVLATVQSSDGLNQQVYNRCVGTRYCANNCPYKVRRFNWFDYAHDDKLENMVLNPDIVVRTRGVMEKCSMCIQRIQEGKLAAKKEGRDVQDGEIKLACQQSCPSDAIVFGDINDPNSEISRKLKDPRYYRVLEELGVAPRVGYLTKIRNK